MRSVMNLNLPCPSRSDVALSELTTFRMGGRVPLLVEPRNRDEFADAISILREEGLSFRMLGGGANVLIDDHGLDDIIVLTRGFSFMMRDGDGVHVLRLAAGLSIPTFVSKAREMGLAGAECLVGIPGTMGGATVMNAGGRHGWLSGIARRVRVLRSDGTQDELAVTDDTFGYRTSVFGDEEIVLETVVELQPGDPDRVQETTREILQAKKTSQPLTEASAGCVFKNPADGSAGLLLEQAGVKGMAVGDAAVSEKHGNFIVNRGKATLAEVRALIEAMRNAVKDSAGVELRTEVRIWSRED